LIVWSYLSSSAATQGKSKYGGLEVSDAKRLKGLEDENRRLKRLLADSLLDNASLFIDQTGAQSPLGSDRSKHLFLAIPYFDDIVLPTYSNWAGELLAINEFNAEHEMRKIEQYRFLRSRPIFKNARWIDQIFILHLFDPPRIRQPHARRVMQNVYLNEFDSD
jgi:hypothetical protein